MRPSAEPPSTARWRFEVGAARAAVTANWTRCHCTLSDPEPAVKLAAIEALVACPFSTDPRSGSDRAGGRSRLPRRPTVKPLTRAWRLPSKPYAPSTFLRSGGERHRTLQPRPGGTQAKPHAVHGREQDPLIRAAGTAIAADPENLLRLALNDSSAGVRIAAANRILGDGVGTYVPLALNSGDGSSSAVAGGSAERPGPRPRPRCSTWLVTERLRSSSPVQSTPSPHSARPSVHDAAGAAAAALLQGPGTP